MLMTRQRYTSYVNEVDERLLPRAIASEQPCRGEVVPLQVVMLREKHRLRIPSQLEWCMAPNPPNT
jgi:hypothetical protein